MELFTLKEVSKIVELSPDTLRKYINLGKLKAIKKGRDWFMNSRMINKLLERHSTDEISIDGDHLNDQNCK